MKHKRIEIPVYYIWVNAKPSLSGRGKDNYLKNVQIAAKSIISDPIKSNDIEIEIVYVTNKHENERMDVDNVNKPTLDALKNIAYDDDKQVRFVSSNIFDKNKNHAISGRVEHLGKLFYSQSDDVVLITIYSDSRIQEMGGEEKVKELHYNNWVTEFNNIKNSLTK